MDLDIEFNLQSRCTSIVVVLIIASNIIDVHWYWYDVHTLDGYLANKSLYDISLTNII
jgi:hypothetical protein